MASPSFTQLLTESVAVWRNPAKTAGNKIGAQVLNAAAVIIVPPMPVGPEIEEKYEIKAGRRGWVSYADSTTDILYNDTLIDASSTSYRVVAAAPWPGDEAFLELILSEVL